MTVYRSGLDTDRSFSIKPEVELVTILVFVIGGLMLLLLMCRCCISQPTRGLLAPYREPTTSMPTPMPSARVLGRRIQLATVTGSTMPTGATPRRIQRLLAECAPSAQFPTEERAPFSAGSIPNPRGRTPHTAGWTPHIVGTSYPTVRAPYPAMPLPTAAPNATDISEMPPPSYEEVMGKQ